MNNDNNNNKRLAVSPEEEQEIEKALEDYLNEPLQFIINDQFIANALTAQAQMDGLIKENEYLLVSSIDELQQNTFGVECKIERRLLN